MSVYSCSRFDFASLSAQITLGDYMLVYGSGWCSQIDHMSPATLRAKAGSPHAI